MQKLPEIGIGPVNMKLLRDRRLQGWRWQGRTAGDDIFVPNLGVGLVTLSNTAHSNSSATSGSRRADDFVPRLHVDALNASNDD
jgi:hypothetical protein